MRPVRIVLIVFGVLGSLVGFGLVVGGSLVSWAYATQRDDAGYFTTATERFATTTSALSTDPVDLGERGRKSDWRGDWGDLVTVRVQVESPDRQPIFVGIGAEADVQEWLEETEHSVISELDFRPFDVTYDDQRGERPPAAPTAQDFWSAQSRGRGRQTIEWEPEPGTWTLVVMDPDGEGGLVFDASVGAKSDLVLPIAVGMVGFGALSLVVGSLLIVAGAVWRKDGDATAAGTAVPSDAPYPVHVAASLEHTSRWLFLVKWLLLIPHFVVLFFLWLAFAVVTVIAGFAILFSGRYPRRFFDFNVGVVRWTWRVHFYGYGALGTDRYPPFTLDDVPDYPARVDVAYPEHLSRGLVLVKWWLLAIPHYVIVGVFTGSATAAWADQSGYRGGGVGLIGFLVLVAAVTHLFGRRYPKGIFDFVTGMNRWAFRVLAYAALMRDEYPPFRLDAGGTEPSAERTAEPDTP
jgi:hypothetical protein